MEPHYFTSLVFRLTAALGGTADAQTTAVIILDTIAKCLNLDRGRLIEAMDEGVKKGVEAHADRLTMHAIADNLPARLKKWVNKRGWGGAESGPRKDPKGAVQTLADKWSWCSMYNRGKCGPDEDDDPEGFKKFVCPLVRNTRA